MKIVVKDGAEGALVPEKVTLKITRSDEIMVTDDGEWLTNGFVAYHRDFLQSAFCPVTLTLPDSFSTDNQKCYTPSDIRRWMVTGEKQKEGGPNLESVMSHFQHHNYNLLAGFPITMMVKAKENGKIKDKNVRIFYKPEIPSSIVLVNSDFADVIQSSHFQAFQPEERSHAIFSTLEKDEEDIPVAVTMPIYIETDENTELSVIPVFKRLNKALTEYLTKY